MSNQPDQYVSKDAGFILLTIGIALAFGAEAIIRYNLNYLRDLLQEQEERYEVLSHLQESARRRIWTRIVLFSLAFQVRTLRIQIKGWEGIGCRLSHYMMAASAAALGLYLLFGPGGWN